MRLFIGLVLGLGLLTIFWLGPENVMQVGRQNGAALIGAEYVATYSAGATVAVPAGGQVTFRTDGAVQLMNTCGHYPVVAPAGTFTIVPSDDGWMHTIIPKSGMMQTAHVTSIADPETVRRCGLPT